MNFYIFIGTMLIAIIIFIYLAIRMNWVSKKFEELLPKYANESDEDFNEFEKVLHLDKIAMKKFWCWDINKLIGNKLE